MPDHGHAGDLRDPSGTDSKGFPMGLQISAPNGSDRLVWPPRQRWKVSSRRTRIPALTKHCNLEGLDHVQAPVYSMPRNGDAHLGALTYGYSRSRLPTSSATVPEAVNMFGVLQIWKRRGRGKGWRVSGLVRLRNAIGPNQQSNPRSPP